MKFPCTQLNADSQLSGQMLRVGSRVLLMGQTSAIDNGIDHDHFGASKRFLEPTKYPQTLRLCAPQTCQWDRAAAVPWSLRTQTRLWNTPATVCWGVTLLVSIPCNGDRRILAQDTAADVEGDTTQRRSCVFTGSTGIIRVEKGVAPPSPCPVIESLVSPAGDDSFWYGSPAQCLLRYHCQRRRL